MLQIVGIWLSAGVQVGDGDGDGIEPITVNVRDFAEPLGVFTVMGPVCAPLGTVTVIFVEVKLPDAEAFPVKTIESGGTKPVPFMTTVLPTEPEVGAMLVMVGGDPESGRATETAAPDEVIRSWMAGEIAEFPLSQATNEAMLTKRMVATPKYFKTNRSEARVNRGRKGHVTGGYADDSTPTYFTLRTLAIYYELTASAWH